MTSLAGDTRIRRSGIGGSDIAMIAGVSKWGGPMDVYLTITGQSAPLIETERMRWGKLLEDAVAKEYAVKTGRKVRNAPTAVDSVTGLRDRIMRDKSASWRMAHVDRLVICKPGETPRGLECKTADRLASSDFGEEGTDQVPADYALQCQWYMGITGLPLWDLAVLIGGNQHRLYTITRDDELIDMLRQVADDFWLNHVVAKVPPPIDGTDASKRFLEAGHVHPEDEIDMTDRLYALAERYATLKAEIKEREAAVDETANAIREQMQGAGVSVRDRVKVRWSVNTVRRLDAAAIREAHPELAAKYVKESEEHRLTVTVKEAA